MSELEPEAQRLKEAMHAGTLPRERLTLGDYLGHAPCTAALGRERSASEEEPAPDLVFWGRRLARWGPTTMMRIAVALSRSTAEATAPPPEVQPALKAGLAEADRFLDPSQPPSVPAEVRDVSKSVARAALQLEADAPPRRACQTLLPVLRAILDVLDGGVPNRMLIDPHYVRSLEQAQATGLPLERLQAAVRRELLAWALESDSGNPRAVDSV